MYSKVNTKEMFKRAQNGDKEAREVIITENMRMVYKVVQRRRRNIMGHVDYDTLVQEGSIGLINAVDKFDVNKGFQFSTFVITCINQQINNFLRDKREDRPYKIHRDDYKKYKAIKEARTTLEQEFQEVPKDIEVAIYLNMTPDEVRSIENYIDGVKSIYDINWRKSDDELMIIDTIEDKEDKYENAERKIFLEQALKELPKQEVEVIKLRYEKNLSQQRVAKIIGVSQPQVFRIEKRALKKLKEVIEGCLV